MDDPDTSSKILFFLEQFWSFLAVSIGVALGGVAAKRVVAVFVPTERSIWKGEDSSGGQYRSTAAEVALDPSLPLWYRLWRASISFHPVIVGGLFGFAPLPAANWVPDGYTAHIMWFGLAGAVSGQAFEIGKRVSEIIPALIRQRLGLRSDPPPAAGIADEIEKIEDPGTIPPKE